MRKLSLLFVLPLAACAGLPGPSVPMQQGKTLQMANAAIQSCAPYAPKGGKNAVVGGYVTGVMLGGLIVGPAIVATNEDDIRARGEARAVDRCLAEQGFKRRDLTPVEMAALKSRDATQRQRLLTHLINGGTVESYSGS